jgi:uncharacterized protein YcaQ
MTWIETEKKKGRLIDVTLAGVANERCFAAVARPDIEAELSALADPTSRLRALSPFDPVLRDRERVKRIFGFDYRIEIYVPGHRRKFGYYVFPLLEGARFVGRIDMKAERQKDRLAVKALWIERGLSFSKARTVKLENESVRDIAFPASALKSV